MTRPRISVVVTVVAALILALLPTRALAGAEAPGGSWGRPLLSYRESGCTEIGYQRGGLASAVRPLVPDRFALADFPGVPEGAPPRVYLLVNEVTCDRGEFRGAAFRHSPYTFLIVSALVTATDGDQRDGAYVLFYATENRTQLNALRRLGWPVTPLSRRTTARVTRDTNGAVLGMALHVVGSGWDHDLAAVATAPPTGVEPSTGAYYRDTPTGPQTLCYANQVSSAPASYSGDLRGTPFERIAYVPPLFTGYPGGLVIGGWDATVTTGTCPTPKVSPRRGPTRS
jgi:hypothetical protein